MTNSLIERQKTFAFNQNITLLSAPMICYAAIAYQLIIFAIAANLSALNNEANHFYLKISAKNIQIQRTERLDILSRERLLQIARGLMSKTVQARVI